MSPAKHFFAAIIAILGLAVVVSGLTGTLSGTDAHAQAKSSGGKGPSMPPEQAKIVKAWSHSLAVQAATYGAPIVGMYNLRETVAVGPKAKAAPGELWRLENIATPKIAAESGYVSPNVNTIYGFGFLDLGLEPVVITSPDSDGRYYMIELVDMWNNAFGYAAGKEAGYQGGTYVLVGPGWKGDVPKDMKRIDAPTRWVAIQPRVHVKNEADLPGALKVLKAIKVQGLAQHQGKPAPQPMKYSYEVPKLAPKVASSQLKFEDPLQFWSIFSAAMNENPPPESQIKAVLPQFKYLGIELGKQWKREEVNALMLEEMKLAAAEIGEMLSVTAPTLLTASNGWFMTPVNFGEPGADYPLRGATAVLALTSNTTTESIYYLGELGADSQLLTGAKKYTITFKEPMSYAKVIPPGFWSVTIYDGITKLTVENKINRYALGSDNELKKNPDGSFTMYLQTDSPGKEKEANWLPAPKGPFYLGFRTYAPGPEAVEGLKNPASAQPLPPIVPVK